MPPIDAERDATRVGAGTSQEFSKLEQANLLSALIKAIPSSSSLPSQTIRQMLTDPVQLSQLIKHAQVQAELAKVQSEPSHNLTTALARVAPQHLEHLLSTLERNVHPAVNLDESYGAPVAFATTRFNRETPELPGVSPFAQGAPLVLDALAQSEAEEHQREPAPDWENTTTGAFYANPVQLNATFWPLFALVLVLIMMALAMLHLL